jgi:hypothetical protein
MSTLWLQLMQGAHQLYALPLTAESVIETTLTITPDWESLPKLVSIATITGKINDAGFELVSEQELDTIADLMTNYYIPTPKNTWRDRTLAVQVLPIAPEHRPHYEEIAQVRRIVIDTARDVDRYNAQRDTYNMRVAQDSMVDQVKEKVESNPSWWSKIPQLIVKTAISTLFDCIVGFPITTLVTSVLGGLFKPRNAN